MADLKFLEWKQTSEKSFQVYYEDESRKIEAEEIEGIFMRRERYHGLMAKKDGKYSLYLKSLGGLGYYNGCYKFEKDILDYKEFGDFLIYKKEDGWYAIKFHSTLWNIHNQFVRHNRIKGINRFCGPDVEILEVKAEKVEDGFRYGICNTIYTANTSDGIFFFYGKNGSVYYELPTECVHCYKYSKIKGYKHMARIYLDKNSRYFVIGRISCGGYAGRPDITDKCLSLKDVGNGYFVMGKGKQKKLIYMEKYFTNTLVDWGKHEITKLSEFSDGTVHFSVDGEEMVFRHKD